MANKKVSYTETPNIGGKIFLDFNNDFRVEVQGSVVKEKSHHYSEAVNILTEKIHQRLLAYEEKMTDIQLSKVNKSDDLED